MKSEYKLLPEIYQVEATTSCQLECDLCHRDQTVAARGGNKHLDPNELARWIARGDFAGSYFVELQMSGEPLLHPRLEQITKQLKDAKLLVGMSTNGLLLKHHPRRIIGLDAITVSVDSMDPVEYAKRRPHHRDRNDGDLSALLSNIDDLLRNPHCPKYVDLQIVAPIECTQDKLDEELAKLRERFPDPRITVRSVWDSFAVTFGRARFSAGKELCLNPWTSVSVQSDGTVVSCCYVWDHNEANTYGNLNDRSLRDIWTGEKVAEMRRKQREGAQIGGWCDGCYRKSPYLIHLGFMPSFIGRDSLRAVK